MRIDGTGLNAGRATGPVVRVGAADTANAPEIGGTSGASAGETPDEAMARFDAARGIVQKWFESQSHAAADKGARDILMAQAMIAADPGLRRRIARKVADGARLEVAVAEACGDYANVLASHSGYVAARAGDVVDIQNRLLAALSGDSGAMDAEIPELSRPSIVVVLSPSPAVVSELVGRETAGNVVGLILVGGSPVAHASLIAGGGAAPAAIVPAEDADAMRDGDIITVDGGMGEVIIGGDDASATDVSQNVSRDVSHRFTVGGVAESPHAHTKNRADSVLSHVRIMANAGTVEEAERAAALAGDAAADGVGLLRTEILYTGRTAAPSVDEQAEAYARVLRAFAPRPVVIRTFDIGADKPLPFVERLHEANPALGVRGIRLGMNHIDLMDNQLAALDMAAKNVTKSQLHVMAPLVTTAEETQWFVDRAHEAGIASAGIMVETPAAALCSDHIMRTADFCSIGTNDLAQYTMAADRTNDALVALLNPWQPAVLRMIHAACQGAASHEKPAGVCGQAAADPILAAVLAGLGVTSLSMPAARIPAVRAFLAPLTLTACHRAAESALTAPDASSARRAAFHEVR